MRIRGAMGCAHIASCQSPTDVIESRPLPQAMQRMSRMGFVRHLTITDLLLYRLGNVGP